MRIWPRSLRGQVLLAVLAALLVAQVVGLVISVGSRERALREARITEAVDSAAALVLVLDRTPPHLRRPLLRAAEAPLTRHRLAPRPAVTVSDPALSPYLARLGGAIAVPVQARIRFDAAPRSGWRGPPPRHAHSDNDNNDSDNGDSDVDEDDIPRRERDFRRFAVERGVTGEALRLSLPLADGSWLNSTVGFQRPDPMLPRLSVLSFILSALAIGAVLWVVLARLLGPLRRLSMAAEALGRGEAETLPVTGPSEMQALTVAFNQMQERLHRLVQDRTQMLAALGHDLRSPLTALRLRVEMLEDDDDRERMTASLDEMQEMVEQTLAYARGVWSAEGVEAIDLAALVGDLAEEARAAGCAVDWPGAPPLGLRARPVALRRALRNLLDNACRYGQRARISLTADADHARLVIADDGPGIPEDALARVFDPFVRIETSRSRETGGTGLGLSIAQGVLRAHGGTITLANRAGGGLEAVVTLPRPAG